MTNGSSDTSQRPVVLVTAGASGIGAELAKSFLARGDAVHICDIDQALLDDAVKNGLATGASLCDVSRPDQVKAMFDDIHQRYARLDVLINNAGIAGPTATLEDIDIDDWDRTLAVDLSGAFYVTRLAVKLLKQGAAGSIINMGSSAGLHGCPLRSPYVASKWALIGLTKTWAMELGPAGIRVNAICPGSVAGPRIDEVIARDAARRGTSAEQIRESYHRQSSLRRFVDAGEIASLATFLASEAGAGISGQALSVDGHTESLSL